MLRKAIALLFLLCQIEVFSQTDSLKTYYLDSVTITASKYGQTLRNLIPSTSYISNEALRQDVKSEALSVISGRVPGLFITERGFEGFGISGQSAGKISIRGVGGTGRVLVTVDGKPEFSGIFGHPLPDGYASTEIEGIEVVRGPASVIYGSGAMGGVINITTKKNHNEGFNFSADVNYGSFDTRKLSGSLGYKGKDYGLSLSVDEDRTNGSLPSSSFNSKIASLNSFYYLSSIWSLNLDGYVNRSKAFIPEQIDLGKSEWTDVTRANVSLALRNKFDNSEGEALLYFNNGVHDVYDGFHSNDNTLGISLHQNFQTFNSGSITAGADFKRYGGKGSASTPIIDTTVNETGVFALLEQPIIEKVKLNCGLRFQNHSVFGNILIPHFSVQYIPIEQTYTHITISEGYRSPVITELFLSPMFQPYKNLNTSLKPEKLWNYEAGIKQKLFDGKLTVDLNAFLIEGKDYIASTGQYPFFKYENINKIKNRGIEFWTVYEAMQNLVFDANYSYTSMDTKIVGAPESQAFIECVYKIGAFSFSANMKIINNLYASVGAAPSLDLKQSYALTNAAVSFRAAKNISVYVNGDNLTDRSYQINAGYPMPGATVIAGINYNCNFGS